MQTEKRAKLQLRTNKAFGVEVTTQHTDPRYKLVVHDSPVSTEHGDLRLFSIEPQGPGLPSLSGRWDHKHNTVDIDLIRNDRYKKKFRGHRTDNNNNAPGVYHIDIHIPEGHIFTGSIKLGTELALLLEDSMQTKD